MVVTRSQGEAAEVEDRSQETERVRQERMRRLVLDPLASPSDARLTSATETMEIPPQPRRHSPARSARSVRSSASTARRIKAAELEAAERLAAIQRKELQIEKELINKRLQFEVSAIQEDEGLPEDTVTATEERNKVDEWLQSHPVPKDDRHQRSGLRRGRSPTPTRRTGIEQLAASLEKMARPRLCHADLPIFSGAIEEWLPFRAAYRDTSSMYQVSDAENIQRLRTCLKGEARDAVAALLHTASSPEAVMKTLEQCFGRPEIIIDRAMEDLRKLPRPGAAAKDINCFAVKVQNVVCILQTIDRKGYLYNPMLAREILDKLSPHLRSRWCDYAFAQEGTADPEIVVLSRFLMREADRALRYTYAPMSSTAPERRDAAAAAAAAAARPAPTKRKSAVYTMVSGEDEEEKKEEKKEDFCLCCGRDHAMVACPRYAKLSVDERWALVREKGACFKCATKRHRRSYCRAKPCGVNQCRRPHHSSLHDVRREEPAASTEETVMAVADRATAPPRAVLLKMCPVTVVGPRGEVSTHALLDEGSTITLIDEDLAQQIGAEGPATPLRIHGANMEQIEEGSRLVTVQLRGQSDGTLHDLRARTMKKLQLHQQSIPGSLLRYRHLRDIPEREVCYEQARAGVLVGTDHWEHIVTRELRTGGADEPAASKTSLGWVIHGTTPRRMIVEKDCVLHVREQQADQRLHDLVAEHFKIESLNIASRPRISDADRRATSIVETTTKKTPGGYEIGLPWKRDNVRMPPSYNAALRRLLKIEAKMDAAPEFAAEYTKQMNNLFEKRYAVPCDGSEGESSVCWYLPHFAVTNPNKPGKQRLVFDAAAKSHGTCLNDELLEGPDLLLSLPGILFRFREKAVAVTADIEEMFLQVKIRPEDQPAQQFLWRGSRRDTPPQHYKMTSMIFGAASSPFMAHYIRNHNAQQHAEQYPMALEAITKSHYMDDLVVSYADAGLIWDAEQDALGFNTAMNRVPVEVRDRKRPPTKREALSAVMSIYDPLGLLSYFTIRAKIILQSLWRLQISWDEPIPEEEGEHFAGWLSQLEAVGALRLPRCYAMDNVEDIELHVLCDASEQAYAAVAYWRMRRTDGNVQVKLVSAKAKVAPRRAQTIPRLELQAAVIGARLADQIRREHRYDISRTWFWTDSSTVVHWVRNDAKRYTPFVAHRLGEIGELTQKEEWRWLPTHENVADDATRLSFTTGHDRWFQGPEFLMKTEDQWPTEKELRETTDEADVLHVSELPRKMEWLPDPERFSKFRTLVGATARVLAFIDMRIRHTATRLECRHLEQAERLLVQRAQNDSFGTRAPSADPVDCTNWTR
ncbi:uncharacterized protein LOC123697038 [Colias croceus]|uniref:uncharacterized protein LOC123697038 n=1 Tax=Colias crocea TaxID=72248 RepID=UPI001E27F400|nr:uncharacterized protein LOC123697038 [Colias croceus]